MSTSTTKDRGGQQAGSGLALKIVGAWTFVGVPLAYGIIETVRKASALFTG